MDYKIRKSYSDILSTKAHIINLPSSRARRRNMLWQCRSKFIDAYFHEATSQDALPAILSRMPILNKPTQIACLVSHLRLLSSFSNRSDLKLIYCVLEDDCILHHRFFKAIQYIIPFLPQDWEILQLGTSNLNAEEHHQRLFHLGVPCTKWDSEHWGTYAYIIKASAACRIAGKYLSNNHKLDLREWYSPGKVVSDMVLYTSGNSYSATYALAAPSKAQSLIGYEESVNMEIARSSDRTRQLWRQHSYKSNYISVNAEKGSDAKTLM